MAAPLKIPDLFALPLDLVAHPDDVISEVFEGRHTQPCIWNCGCAHKNKMRTIRQGVFRRGPEQNYASYGRGGQNGRARDGIGGPRLCMRSHSNYFGYGSLSTGRTKGAKDAGMPGDEWLSSQELPSHRVRRTDLGLPASGSLTGPAKNL
jgi:hypothetical protein